MNARTPIRTAVLDASRKLCEAGIKNHREEAEAIAEYATNVDGRFDSESFAELIARRSSRVPLEYLTGMAVFGDIQIEVTPGVFIPREQSQGLVRWALQLLEGAVGPVVVDLCTGAGALAIAVSKAREDARVIGIELDKESLACARRNAARLKANGTFMPGDVSDPKLLLDLAGNIDLIICNPPYKPNGVRLIPEFAQHQPDLSIFGGDDGLDVIKHVILRATQLLRPGGALLLEHDARQSSSVPELLRSSGSFAHVEVRRGTDEQSYFTTGTRGVPCP